MLFKQIGLQIFYVRLRNLFAVKKSMWVKYRDEQKLRLIKLLNNIVLELDKKFKPLCVHVKQI